MIKIGDNILRTFKSDTTFRGKQQFQYSLEQYQVIEISDTTVTINELGNKSDGTYGYREYNRKSGLCIDDKVAPANKSRRSIKIC